jgi:hypothetical protein
MRARFGLSKSLRRKALLALASAALLTVVCTLALTAGRSLDREGRPLTSRSEEVGSGGDITPAAVAYPPAGSSPALQAGKAECAGDPWSQIDGKCNAAKLHKRRSAQAKKATMISNLPLGHSGTPTTAPPAALVDSADSDKKAGAPTLAKSDPPSDPPGSRVSAPTKAHEFSRARNPGRDPSRYLGWRGDFWSARAFVPPHSRNQSDDHTWSRGWNWCSAPSCDKPSTRSAFPRR